VNHPAQWKKAINDAKFRQLCALEGDMLSRPPKGYDPGHPLIDDLKRKDFIAVTNLDLTLIRKCAVKRRWSTEGGSPSRELVRSAR